MPGYEERASILQDAGAMIFNMVRDRATPKQWAEWLRVPLEHAAGMGNADLVHKLMKAGADGRAGWEGCDGKSLLHAGAEGGNEQVMSALMSAGGKEDIHTKTVANGRTPLHLATLGGKGPAAKVLMMAGADVNVRGADGDGPLHLAIVGGHAGIAENLLLRGADPELQNSSGDFPIHLAARRRQNGVVRYLLHTGAQVNRSTDRGRTPLGDAVSSSHLSTVKVLLYGGADVGVLCDGHTPLHIAAKRNSKDILAALVEAGADIEARSLKGNTPLHLSANYGSCAAMLALLQLGADLHAKSLFHGSTPLHRACQHVKLDAADLLLRWGADETTLDKRGKTPSARIPNIAEAAKEDRPRLERLSKLLASAPHDKAWRRRGMLVLCRAHPDRGDGGGAGFDGVAACLMALREEDVFRKIVGFL